MGLQCCTMADGRPQLKCHLPVSLVELSCASPVPGVSLLQTFLASHALGEDGRVWRSPSV